LIGSRRAETLLGLAVAVGLAAAFLALRDRPWTGAGTPAAAGGTPADVPDVTRADAVLDVGDLRLRVSAGPRPLLAFARNGFRVRAERHGSPVVLADAVVSFTMEMPMGDHRHALSVGADGWQEADAALPLCMSGRRRWIGTLDFTVDERPRSIRFAFDLAPPPGPSAGPAGR
jgi:hypothetical protein